MCWPFFHSSNRLPAAIYFPIPIFFPFYVSNDIYFVVFFDKLQHQFVLDRDFQSMSSSLKVPAQQRGLEGIVALVLADAR